MSNLSIQKGIGGLPTATIPEEPAAFVKWFKHNYLPRWAPLADVRNAQTGQGVSIVANPATTATIDVSPNVKALFAQPYILAAAGTPGVLTADRLIAVQSGVLTGTDGGALGAYTLGVATNGIGNVQLRQGGAHTVIGNASAATANVADLSQTQLTALINVATASLSGACPVLSGVSTQFLNGSGSFATPSYPVSANPSATIGLSAVNGSAGTFMTSDSAPALSPAIAPTWTAPHTFTPSSGVGVTINAYTSQPGATINQYQNTNGLVVAAASTYAAKISIAANGNAASSGLLISQQSAGGATINNAGGGSIAFDISGTPYITMATSGVTFKGPIGANNVSPPAQVTGWGTPTSNSVIANFSGASSAETLTQVCSVVAQIITDLKNFGIYAA